MTRIYAVALESGPRTGTMRFGTDIPLTKPAAEANHASRAVRIPVQPPAWTQPLFELPCDSEKNRVHQKAFLFMNSDMPARSCASPTQTSAGPIPIRLEMHAAL